MSNTNMTQVQKLLLYLRENREISALSAMLDLGIGRLSARIYEIRHTLGIPVYEKRERRLNRFGEACTVYKYSLQPFTAEEGAE